MKHILLILVLSSCAGTTRLISRKCPVPTTAVLGDFFTGLGAMTVAAIKNRAGKPGEALAYSTVGLTFLVTSYGSEYSCLRK